MGLALFDLTLRRNHELGFPKIRVSREKTSWKMKNEDFAYKKICLASQSNHCRIKFASTRIENEIHGTGELEGFRL